MRQHGNSVQLLEEFLVKFPYFCFRSHCGLTRRIISSLYPSLTFQAHGVGCNRRFRQHNSSQIRTLRHNRDAIAPRTWHIKCRTCFPPRDFSLIFSCSSIPPTRRPIRTIRSAPPFVLLSAFSCKW